MGGIPFRKPNDVSGVSLVIRFSQIILGLNHTVELTSVLELPACAHRTIEETQLPYICVRISVSRVVICDLRFITALANSI
jgi:hypothetical protein